MRRTALRLGLTCAIAAFAIALVAAPGGGGTRASQNTWAGLWTTDFGDLTMDAGGSGHYTGFSPGDVHGTIKGNTLTGEWVQATKKGTFKFTRSEDGRSFTGVWAYESGGCGTACGWNGSCKSGLCLKNSIKGNTGGGGAPGCGHRTPQSRRAGRAINEVRVVAVNPDVQYHCAGGPDEEWLEVERGTVLKQGDEISCDPDGSVTLAFADNSTVTVRNTTQLKIASFFTEGGVVRTEILLKMGEIAAKVHRSEATKSDFRIKDPTATASVRGTVFSVFYDKIAKVGVTSVTRGVVEVDPTAGGLKTVMVPAGKEVAVMARSETKVVGIGKAGTPPGAISRQAARTLVLKQIARFDEKCKITVVAFGMKPAAKGWTVSVRTTGGRKGWATWKVTGKQAVASNPLAKTIVKGCR